jgi:hypothetical protein
MKMIEGLALKPLIPQHFLEKKYTRYLSCDASKSKIT